MEPVSFQLSAVSGASSFWPRALIAFSMMAFASAASSARNGNAKAASRARARQARSEVFMADPFEGEGEDAPSVPPPAPKGSRKTLQLGSSHRRADALL